MSLTVLSGGRRKVIKLTPNTAMQSVLEMACKEHGIADWSSYGLVHKKASVDLSQPFRFTGIPNNANVDLVELRGGGKQQVRVALQAAGGRRWTETFDADTTIAEIVGHWVSAGQLDELYATAEDVQVVFMRQNYQGREALQTTSLRSMGLSSGSALLNVRVQSNGSSGVASATNTSMETHEAGSSSGGGGGGGSSGGSSGGGVDDEGEVGVEESKGDPARAAQYVVSYASANEPIPMDVVGPPPSSSSADPPHPPLHTHTHTDTHPPLTFAPSTEPQRSPTTPRMERGLDAAKAALEQLRASGFDDDVKESFALLAKYIDNIVGRPGETKTRTIRCSNIHYQQKIGSRAGGPAFLAALGFVEELRGFDHQVARDPAAFTYLVLPAVHEDTPLLLRARALLQDAARGMDLDIGPAPDPERRRASLAAAPAFDPFKPSFMSTAMQVPRDQGPSVTEQKLAELKRKQSEIQGQLLERSIQVFPPGVPVSQSPVAGASSSASSAMVEDTDDRDSQAIVAKSVAARMAQRRKDEDRPFTTRALRELESLEKAKVYAHTVLRITMSDRTVVLAKFHPKERVGDVRRVLRDEVLSEVGKTKPFTLYMSPPKRILQDSSVLQEEGMVPAAVVYLSFDDNASSSMDLISEGLLAHAVDQSSGGSPPQALYPVGVRLVERPQEEEKTMRASGSGAAGGGRGGGSEQQAKKPAWLKL